MIAPGVRIGRNSVIGAGSVESSGVIPVMKMLEDALGLDRRHGGIHRAVARGDGHALVVAELQHHGRRRSRSRMSLWWVTALITHSVTEVLPVYQRDLRNLQPHQNIPGSVSFYPVKAASVYFF